MFKQIIIGILLFGFFFPTQALAEENPDELYRQGNFTEAEKAYAKKDMDRPKDIRYRYNRGCAAYQNSDFQGARAAFASVLRRAEAQDPQSVRRNEETCFKTAYNLGNTAFKQGDFGSAVASYKEAILYNPENEDAKYNLELALRELEKQKKSKTEEQKRPTQKDPGKPEDTGDRSGSGKKEKGPDKGKPESEKKGEPDRRGDRPDESRKAEKESPQDLSGELKSLQALPENQGEDQPPEQADSVLDRKKAEALLDNLKEDRSRFLRFQVPKDKRHGVLSGKDW